jgi:dipeptidyl aminopeptidase/acylaminoacyl peptidase
VGVADLVSTVRSFPAYWGPAVAEIHAVFGDPDVPAQAERMRAVSPVHLADRIRIPLLVGQGANDVRVKKEQAEAIFAAVARSGGRATYVLYGDEGHGPPGVGPDVLANRVDWYARVEAFLAEHLGGRAEPLDRSRAAPSTAVVQESRPPAPVAPAAGTR